MKKKEYQRDTDRQKDKGARKDIKKIQEEADAAIPESNRNPNAKEDMERMLKAIVPPLKYIKKADRPKKD